MAIKSGLSAQIGMAEEVYTNEVQTISGTPSGTFGINFDGALTTITLTTSATAVSIQTALNALWNLGGGVGTTEGVTVTGGPLPSLTTVTFSGALVSGKNVPALTVQGATTGLTFATTVPGTGYGDPVTVTRFLEFTDESLALTLDHIASTAIRTGNRLLRSDRRAANRKGAAGDVNWEVANTGFGLLFKHMWGSSVVSTPSNGVLTRDHTYTLADPTGKSLSVQVGRTSLDGTCNAFTYKGSKINGWELSNAVDGELMLKTTFDSMDEDTTVSLASASYPASQSIFNYTQGQITVQGGNADVTNITLTYDPGIKTDRYFLRTNTLKKEPVPNAMVAFTGTIDVEFASMGMYSLFQNATSVALTATWVGAQIEAVTPNYFYQVALTCPLVQLDGITPNVAGPDILTQSIPITVLWDGTTAPSMVYRTTDTAD
jgi:hypothetical protein